MTQLLIAARLLAVITCMSQPLGGEAPKLQTGASIWDRGTWGTRSPNIWTGGHYHECPPQYF